MKPWLLPSGLQRGIPFLIPDDWSPEQALAAVELLDDLREVIWSHYRLQLREQRCTDTPSDSSSINKIDPPF